MRWAKLPAEAGDLSAVEALGVAYLELSWHDDAKHWLREAANAERPVAMCHLGVLLRERGGIESARAWFKRAYEAGYEPACIDLENLSDPQPVAEDARPRHRHHHAYRAPRVQAPGMQEAPLEVITGPKPLSAHSLSSSQSRLPQSHPPRTGVALSPEVILSTVRWDLRNGLFD